MKAALSVAFSDLRGKAGDVVAQGSPTGLVIRPRVVPRNPDTPAQRAVRNDLARATAAYRDMPPTRAEAWRAYARSRTKTDPVTGHTYSPSAVAVFTGLATKLLQVDPDAQLPFPPPTQDFLGDTITVKASMEASPVSPSRHPGECRGPGMSQGEVPEHPKTENRKLKTPQEPHNVTFTASAPNAPGVITELLLQPLPSPNRTPKPRDYRTQAFVAFTPENLTATIPVEPGCYAAAYRFVDPATGRSTMLVALPDTLPAP